MIDDQGLPPSVSTNLLEDVLSLESSMRLSGDESREDSFDVVFENVRLNLINNFVSFILCQFTCNSVLRNLLFMWESYKGSM